MQRGTWTSRWPGVISGVLIQGRHGVGVRLKMLYWSLRMGEGATSQGMEEASRR